MTPPKKTPKATSFRIPPTSPVVGLVRRLVTLIEDDLPVRAKITQHAAVELALTEAIEKRTPSKGGG